MLIAYKYVVTVAVAVEVNSLFGFSNVCGGGDGGGGEKLICVK